MNASRSRHALSRLAATGACLALAACIPLPFGHTVDTRVVSNKQGENVLVSSEGSYCRVKGDVFDKVQVGDEHRCAWSYAPPNGGKRTVPQANPPRPRTPPAIPETRVGG